MILYEALMRCIYSGKENFSLMNSISTPERRRSQRLPGKEAQVLLATHRGNISGVLVNYSETGALVAADGNHLAGSHVVLCLKESGKIRRRAGKIVWFSTIRGIAIEFELGARAES